MRISPQQYFEYQQPVQPPVQNLQLESNNTLHFIIIGIVAGVALGLAIAAVVKK